ncbi:MAG: isoprenylcysteine carboxylmethyltransferase family protein [Gemmatimonadaceae bacterium]|nr:isoprenylcysteine carboxylmethyltransferase family protein [Gemmatimonadaceae bacterium]
MPGLPANPAWLVTLGNFLFKTRDGLFPVVLIALIALSRPMLFHDNASQARIVDGVAVTIAALGQLLRVAVIGYRYIVRGGRNREVYAEGLVTTGFFSLSRNPLYVGNIMILVGLLLLWHSTLAIGVGIPLFLLAYRAIVAAEEAYLGRQYGAEYGAYCVRVPRWWPRLGGIRAATAGMTFNWRRVILKEYGSAAYWMAGAAVLLFLKARRYAEVDGSTVRTWPYAAAVALVAVLWGAARWLKKSRRLREDGGSPRSAA